MTVDENKKDVGIVTMREIEDFVGPAEWEHACTCNCDEDVISGESIDGYFSEPCAAARMDAVRLRADRIRDLSYMMARQFQAGRNEVYDCYARITGKYF